mmetsp:Transcript_14883/g.25354  ORF Transcript_14883/g.25354 Transcript_14883/m.25354 type:complete len:128 (+) Transcript_14883:740-1123(+)
MVIVGGGAAGMNCSETLRQSQFTGEIIMISNEDVLPYDRTLLSKGLPDVSPQKLLLRSKEFFEEYGIDCKLNSEVVAVDKEAKKVTLKSGEVLAYDKLLMATGGRARVPPTPGIDLKNIFVLRSGQD